MSRAATGRRRRRLQLRDALFLSLPVLLVIAYAATAALLDYRRAVQFDDWWSQGRRLNGQLGARLASAAALPRMTAVRDRLDPAFDDPRALRILVDRELWEGVTDLGQRGWVDATLVREGGNRQIDIRRRGDTSVHWTTPKVSLTLRAPRGEEIRGFRELALTGKTVLESQIAHSIAVDYGLLAPFSTLAPVYLNEQFYGLFRTVEPIDESFLRRSRRMPGNIFRADLAERGEYYKNAPRNVFHNPYIWDRVAELNDPADRPLERLTHFLERIRGTTLESHLGLMELVELREIGALLATVLTVGDPYHMSGVHNQYWFDDPALGTLHPIPWDLRLRSIEAPPTNPLNPFFRAVLRDPRVADATLKAIRDGLEGGLVERVGARVDSFTQRLEPHFEYERLRSGLVSDPGDAERVGALVRENAAELERRIADARLGFTAFASREQDDMVVLDLEVRGWAGIDLTSLAVTGVGNELSVRADIDRDGLRGDGDRVLPATVQTVDDESRLVLERPLELLPAWGIVSDRIAPERTHYRLFVTGPGISGVRAEVVNRVTGGPVEIAEIDAGDRLGGRTGFHAWEIPLAEGRDISLEGTVELTSDLLVGEADRLLIEAGTTVRLAPDVSVLARGRVIARGEPGRPIRFEALDARLPWGSLALLGAGTSGSRFEHVEFSRGGGARLAGVTFKGMVSVHGAHDVRLTDVSFADNRRSDDSFNAVYAEAHLERCLFTDANGDAVDYDYSNGSISECVFERSRNDAIDLMTSSPLIRSNVMRESGDKGVSIGEASMPVLIDNEIVDSTRGIEIKDRSDPLIVHTTIRGAAIGILGQVKNWRYGDGGRGRVVRSRIEGNDVDVSLDGRSRLVLTESVTDSAPDQSAAAPATWPAVAFGIPEASEPGAVGMVSDPREPVFTLRFDDPVPFDETPLAWSATGRIRLRHQNRVLRASVERGQASWETAIDWVLTDAGEMTVETVGRDVLGARVVLLSDSGEVAGDLEIPLQPGRTGLVTVSVPPGSYHTLRFEAESDPGAVRVDPVTGLGERRGGRIDVIRVLVHDTRERP